MVEHTQHGVDRGASLKGPSVLKQLHLPIPRTYEHLHTRGQVPVALTLIACGCRDTVTLPTHVTSYFDEDGYLAHHIFRKDVLGLLQKFEEEIEKPHLDSKKSL